MACPLFHKIKNHPFPVSAISSYSFFVGGVSVEGGSERASLARALQRISSGSLDRTGRDNQIRRKHPFHIADLDRKQTRQP
jgi:hypothetical protein